MAWRWSVCGTAEEVWSPGFFDSGLQLISIFWSLVSHFPLDYTPLILYVQVWWVCWPIKHSNTVVIEPAFGTFGTVGRWQILSLFEISYKKKLTFSQHSNSLRCTCVYIYIYNTYVQEHTCTLYLRLQPLGPAPFLWQPWLYLYTASEQGTVCYINVFFVHHEQC